MLQFTGRVGWTIAAHILSVCVLKPVWVGLLPPVPGVACGSTVACPTLPLRSSKPTSSCSALAFPLVPGASLAPCVPC